MTQYMQEAGAMKQADELHAAIMNLPLGSIAQFNEAERLAYLAGHQTARHYAAELVAAALPPAAVQAGWKLVPIELTPAMVKADPYGMGYGRLHAIWSRLLAAVDEGTLTAGKQGGDGVRGTHEPHQESGNG